MIMYGGPMNGKDLEAKSDTVMVPVCPEIKAYSMEDTIIFFDRFGNSVMFHAETKRQISPPPYGRAKYIKKRYCSVDWGAKKPEAMWIEGFIYEETTWPDDSLETFLRENSK